MNTSLFSRAPKRLGLAVAFTVGIVVAPLAPTNTQAADPGGSSKPSAAVDGRAVATFEGRTIDLADDWGEAKACWVDERGNASCYRSEKAMDNAILASGRQLDATSPRVPSTRSASTAEQGEGLRRASCSSSMRLYRNNWYTGGTLYLSQRYVWINLSWYGFDNVVSSYRIGACNTTFRSGSNGGGSTYWGGTSAWNSWSSMSGWNNVLSSVRMS